MAKRFLGINKTSILCSSPKRLIYYPEVSLIFVIDYCNKWPYLFSYNTLHPTGLRWTFYLFFRWWNILFWWEIWRWPRASGFSFHIFFSCSRDYIICCCNFRKNRCMWTVKCTRLLSNFFICLNFLFMLWFCITSFQGIKYWV